MNIEKGIPIPKDKYGRGRPVKYDWSEMDVGDSAFFDSKHAPSAQVSASTYGRANGKKFISRSQDGGRRIWRVE